MSEYTEVEQRFLAPGSASRDRPIVDDGPETPQGPDLGFCWPMFCF